MLTVLISWSWVLWAPRLPSSSTSFRLCPWTCFAPYGPLDTCLDLLSTAPLPSVQRRGAQHKFLQHEGAPRFQTLASRNLAEEFQKPQPLDIQEDVNGEKLTVKKWWIFLVPIFSRFGADWFTVYADFSRLIRDINGEKKTSRYRWAFSRLVFHGLPPLETLVSKKIRQYTSHLYGSTPPICIAVPSCLLRLEERETQQYTSHLYCSTPPICTAVCPPFVWQYFWESTGGWGHRKIPLFRCLQE